VLALAALQRLAEDARRIGHEGDGGKQREVQIHEVAVDALEVAEHRVVVEPHDADDGKAHEICHVRWPLVCERVTEVSEVLRRGNRQHEQRDRDREHAVAERLEARLPHRGSVTVQRSRRSARRTR
jgi:hypothetical protein